MASQGQKELDETDALYTKATHAELNRSFDEAFSLYLRAAQAYLQLARTLTNERSRAKCKTDAGKCLARAEGIKAARKDMLKPVVRDPFSAEEQAYVLAKSAKVNGFDFPLWREAPNSKLEEDFSRNEQPSLGASFISENAFWCRPHEVYAIPSSLSSSITLASSSLQPHQILQNSVTDCSVCSSVIICLHHHRRFGSKLGFSCLYPKDEDGMPTQSPAGHYALRVFLNGAFREILIDDALPFHRDKSPIAMSTAPTFDLWPSLLEKSYMKVMGGYDFPGSNSSIDVHMLTAWIPEHVEIRSPVFESEKVWHRISNAFLRGSCILTVGTGLQRDNIKYSIGSTALLPTHSYAVLDVREINDERWFTILNPWDGSHSLSRDERENRDDMEQLSTHVNSLDLRERTGEVLDVLWNDVLVLFHGIYLNWNPVLFPNQIDFHGAWRLNSKLEKDAAQSQYAHYHLAVTVNNARKGDELWVLLIRHLVDKKFDQGFISLHTQVEDGPQDRSRSMWTVKDYALKGTYTSSTHTLARMTLDDTNSRISIIASYDGPGDDVCFSVIAYSQCNLAWITEPRKATYTRTTEVTLTTKNAGGNSTYPTFMNNPQFSMRIHPESSANKRVDRGSTKPTEKVNALITVEGPRNIPLNVMLVRYEGQRIVQLDKADILATSGVYSYGIAQAQASFIPGEYCIIVSAFEPRHRGPLTLRIESSLRIDIEPIPSEGAGMFCKSIKGLWENGTDGGSPNFGKYTSNPMYEIGIGSTTPLKVRLQLTKHSPGIALNATIYSHSPDNEASQRQIATSGPYSDNISGVVTPQVTLAPGRYLLVVSTYDPGMHSEFQLLVFSKKPDIRVEKVR